MKLQYNVKYCQLIEYSDEVNFEDLPRYHVLMMRFLRLATVIPELMGASSRTPRQQLDSVGDITMAQQMRLLAINR